MNAGRASVLAAALLVGAASADPPKGEDVRFETSDGVVVAATYWPPVPATDAPSPVVIALPMYASTRAAFEPVAGPITDRGMGLLALDPRGHGDSAKQGDEDLSKRVAARDPALFAATHQDVEAAVLWLAKEKKTPKGKIGLLGASVGCSVAIDAAVRAPDDFAAVVCLTPGKDYLGMPTMERVAKWPAGKPILLVASAAEAKDGADPIETKLDGKGAELRIVSSAGAPASIPDPPALHGTNMFGRVADVEDNVANWLALHLAFRRVDLGGGVTAVLGSTGDHLYVGIKATADAKPALDSLAIRVGLGGVTDPWSKTETIDVGKRIGAAAAPRSTGVSRERLGAASGHPFAVLVSLDGKNFLPAAPAAPLFFTLR